MATLATLALLLVALGGGPWMTPCRCSPAEANPPSAPRQFHIPCPVYKPGDQKPQLLTVALTLNAEPSKELSEGSWAARLSADVQAAVASVLQLYRGNVTTQSISATSAAHIKLYLVADTAMLCAADASTALSMLTTPGAPFLSPAFRRTWRVQKAELLQGFVFVLPDSSAGSRRSPPPQPAAPPASPSPPPPPLAAALPQPRVPKPSPRQPPPPPDATVDVSPAFSVAAPDPQAPTGSPLPVPLPQADPPPSAAPRSDRPSTNDDDALVVGLAAGCSITIGAFAAVIMFVLRERRLRQQRQRWREQPYYRREAYASCRGAALEAVELSGASAADGDSMSCQAPEAPSVSGAEANATPTAYPDTMTASADKAAAQQSHSADQEPAQQVPPVAAALVALPRSMQIPRQQRYNDTHAGTAAPMPHSAATSPSAKSPGQCTAAKPTSPPAVPAVACNPASPASPSSAGISPFKARHHKCFACSPLSQSAEGAPAAAGSPAKTPKSPPRNGSGNANGTANRSLLQKTVSPGKQQRRGNAAETYASTLQRVYGSPRPMKPNAPAISVSSATAVVRGLRQARQEAQASAAIALPPLAAGAPPIILPADAPEFIPAIPEPTFIAGLQSGYVYRNGPHGIGYYVTDGAERAATKTSAPA